MSFETSRYQLGWLCDCQSAHPPSNTVVATRYGTKTSQCATLSIGHLNVWGSKIICICIIHVLISYGSSFKWSVTLGVCVHSSHSLQYFGTKNNLNLLSEGEQCGCVLKRAASGSLSTSQSIVFHKCLHQRRATTRSNLWLPWWRTAETRFSWPAEQWVERTGWRTSTLSSVCPSHAEPGVSSRRQCYLNKSQ